MYDLLTLKPAPISHCLASHFFIPETRATYNLQLSIPDHALQSVLQTPRLFSACILLN